MKNVEMRVEGNVLHITVDLDRAPTAIDLEKYADVYRQIIRLVAKIEL